MGEQHQPDGQQFHTQQRQEAEQRANQAQDGQWDAHRLCIRAMQPVQHVAHARRRDSLQSCIGAQELVFCSFHDSIVASGSKGRCPVNGIVDVGLAASSSRTL